MPFKGSIGEMISQCMHEGGRPHDQCIAIAYSIAERGQNHYSHPSEHPTVASMQHVARAADHVKSAATRVAQQRGRR